MNDRIQVGVVPYLNAKPLVDGYESIEHLADFHFMPPAQLATGLAAGQIDVGLVSVVEYLRGDYDILPEVGIVSRGAVNSVLLTGSKPIEEARTVNLDPASLTSCALAVLWYHARLDRSPKFFRHPIDSPEAARCDAQLAIGDVGLSRTGKSAYQVDLGAVWEEWTGRPCVYAAWLVRKRVDLGPVADFLVEAAARSVDSLPAIAMSASHRLGIKGEVCLEYLTSSLQFVLDEQALEGLETLLSLTAKYRDQIDSCVPDFPPVRFSSPVRVNFYRHPALERSAPT